MSAPSGDEVDVVFTYTVSRKEMARRGRLGALVKHSRHDPNESTKPMRDAFNAKFEREVDPDGTLDPEERKRRAEYARKAYMQRLAMASAKARRERKEKGRKKGAAP